MLAAELNRYRAKGKQYDQQELCPSSEIENENGKLPKEAPTGDESQPAKIEAKYENVIVARKKAEESIVERLIREMENSSDDIVNEDINMDDFSMDDIFEV